MKETSGPYGKKKKHIQKFEKNYTLENSFCKRLQNSAYSVGLLRFLIAYKRWYWSHFCYVMLFLQIFQSLPGKHSVNYHFTTPSVLYSKS